MLAGTDRWSCPAGGFAGRPLEARCRRHPGPRQRGIRRARARSAKVIRADPSGTGLGFPAFGLEERFEFGLLEARNEFAVDEERRRA